MRGSHCIVIVCLLALAMAQNARAHDAALFDFSPSQSIQEQAQNAFQSPLLSRSLTLEIGARADTELKQKLAGSMAQARQIICQSPAQDMEKNRLKQTMEQTFKAQRKQEGRQKTRMEMKAEKFKVDRKHLDAFFALRAARMGRVEALWKEFLKGQNACRKNAIRQTTDRLVSPIYLALYHALERLGPLERISLLSQP
jgi:hypothetical protein